MKKESSDSTQFTATCGSQQLDSSPSTNGIITLAKVSTTNIPSSTSPQYTGIPTNSLGLNSRSPTELKVETSTPISTANMLNNSNTGGPMNSGGDTVDPQQQLQKLLATHRAQQQSGVQDVNTVKWENLPKPGLAGAVSSANSMLNSTTSTSSMPTAMASHSTPSVAGNPLANLYQNPLQQQQPNAHINQMHPTQQANLALQSMLSSMILNNGQLNNFQPQLNPLANQLMSQYPAAIGAAQGLYGLQNMNSVGSPSAGKRPREEQPVMGMAAAHHANLLASLQQQAMGLPPQAAPASFLQTAQLNKVHKYSGGAGSPRMAASALGGRSNPQGSDGEDDGYDGVILDCPPAVKREKGRVYVVRGHLKKWDGRRFARCCGVEGCTKLAQGPTNFCKGHGGGTRCKTPGCKKAARGGSDCCAVHGGGKRCKQPSCAKAAVGNDFCRRHGGGKRCQESGCNVTVKGQNVFCVQHGGATLVNNNKQAGAGSSRARSSSETSYQSSWSGQSGKNGVKEAAKSAQEGKTAEVNERETLQEKDDAITSLLAIGQKVVQKIPPVSTKLVASSTTDSDLGPTATDRKNPLMSGGVMSPSSSAVVPLESISPQDSKETDKAKSAQSMNTAPMTVR